MTLREIRGTIETVYQDTEWLAISRWGKLVDCDTYAVAGAIKRGGARLEKRGKNPNKQTPEVTPVADFPKIIAGLALVRQSDRRHPWTVGVDTTHDFTVETRLKAILIYEYPK